MFRCSTTLTLNKRRPEGTVFHPFPEADTSAWGLPFWGDAPEFYAFLAGALLSACVWVLRVGSLPAVAGRCSNNPYVCRRCERRRGTSSASRDRDTPAAMLNQHARIKVLQLGRSTSGCIEGGLCGRVRRTESFN